jgi:hypothetical protein
VFDLKKHFYAQFFEKKHGKILKISRYAGGGAAAFISYRRRRLRNF